MKLGPKATYFRRFSTTSQLNSNFNSECLGNKAWCRQSVGNYRRYVPSVSQNFTEAEHRTGVFVHPSQIPHFASLPGFAHGCQTSFRERPCCRRRPQMCAITAHHQL